MNGVHDMGGMHAFGPVEPEPDEPVFHAEWERRAFALTLAMGATGEWTLDAARFAREDWPAAVYLSRTYYEMWLAGLERLLAERELVGPAEVEAGRPIEPARFGVIRSTPTPRPGCCAAAGRRTARRRARRGSPSVTACVLGP